MKEKPILKYGIGRGNIFSKAAINDDINAKNIMSYILLLPVCLEISFINSIKSLNARSLFIGRKNLYPDRQISL